MSWLAFQSFFSLTFLILECGTVPQLSPVWVQVQVQVQVQEHLQVQECLQFLLRFPLISSDSENREAEAVSDFVGWTRSSGIFSTELCST